MLDVSCGIGTQAIGLAKNGFQVTASDVSERAIERAILEAKRHEQLVAFSVCDMLAARAQHGSGFDIAITCDNSLPHLLTDADILAALKEMFECLRPGGGCLITVRDYDREQRGRNLVKPYGVRERDGKRHLVFQVWDFEAEHYDLTMYFVEEDLGSKEVRTQTMRSRYYAIGIKRLLAMMEGVGFREVVRLDEGFYQPSTRPCWHKT
ncbi:MAG TPA: class I SAM-dependent methyltransferase [Edaphobacter sp.]|nr:class I SAM-dependent methyltransferase [Edaphobacter sp.]